MTELDTHTQILKAAEIRFTQYGYGKTTMAEIARDCEMTAGNLYRYFENKLEIGAEIARVYFKHEHIALLKEVQKKDKSAAERLANYMQVSLRHCHGYFTTAPRVVELVQAMEVQKPCVCDAHQTEKVTMLITLLTEAAASGEFKIADIPATADTIHAAMMVFQYPPLMSRYTQAELEQKAAVMSALFITGLHNHQAKD